MRNSGYRISRTKLGIIGAIIVTGIALYCGRGSGDIVTIYTIGIGAILTMAGFAAGIEYRK